jgi:DNA-binding NarL/FixJ family response regulator
MIRVLLANDHRLVVLGVRAALGDAGDIEVVGEAVDGKDVLSLVDQLAPDVILLDIGMPDLDGLRCLSLLRKQHPLLKVVVLSAFADTAHAHAALTQGASGYLVLKRVDPNELAEAVRQVIGGTIRPVLGVRESGAPGRATSQKLTERELEIVAAVARGLSNRSISRDLCVTEQTVKFHLTNVYRKLGVFNRTQAMHRAYQLGLVETPLVEAVEVA